MSTDNNNKKAIMVEFSEKELATAVGRELKTYFENLHLKILQEKKEDEDRPLSMRQAMEWLGISRSLFSEIVNRGEIVYTPLDPNHSKSQKYFHKKDLRDWLKKKRVKTIDELKKDSKNG